MASRPPPPSLFSPSSPSSSPFITSYTTYYRLLQTTYTHIESVCISIIIMKHLQTNIHTHTLPTPSTPLSLNTCICNVLISRSPPTLLLLLPTSSSSSSSHFFRVCPSIIRKRLSSSSSSLGHSVFFFVFLPVHHQNTTTIIVPIPMGLLLRYERGEIRNQNAVAKLLLPLCCM